MKKIAVLSVFLLILGCNNAKDLKFTGKNTDEVLEKIKKSKDLTGEEIGLLTGALMRYTLSNKTLEGKRVKEVIAEQKLIAVEAEAKEKEAKRLAEEAAKKEAAIAAELAKYIAVAPFKKSFHKADFMSGEYEDRINIDFVFENNGPKDIRAFKGVAKFKDLFGEEIHSSNISHDEAVKAGSKKNWGGSLKFNQFIASQVKLRDTDLSNMKFEWIPKAVIFADGSTIGMDSNK
jgi:hypothetical protein